MTEKGKVIIIVAAIAGITACAITRNCNAREIIKESLKYTTPGQDFKVRI